MADEGGGSPSGRGQEVTPGDPFATGVVAGLAPPTQSGLVRPREVARPSDVQSWLTQMGAMWDDARDARLRREAMVWLALRTNDGRDALSSTELLDFTFDG